MIIFVFYLQFEGLDFVLLGKLNQLIWKNLALHKEISISPIITRLIEPLMDPVWSVARFRVF